MASKLEAEFAWQLRVCGLPAPEREYRFHPSRKWRFDFAWLDRKIAVEIEGGIWNRGRHVRGAGFERDAEKGNAALCMGWRVFRFTPGMVKNGEAVRIIELALRGKK